MGSKEKDSAIHRRASLVRIYAKNRSASTSSTAHHRHRKRRNRPAGSEGDSDSCSSSSNSSDEIHYGPGFVSKIKNRYMSVALRSTSSSSSSGRMRRTASLENFLEQKKKEEEEQRREEEPDKPSEAAVRGRPSRAASKRDSIKRCQSVEVLSVREAAKKPTSPSPPPPLPPKAVDAALGTFANPVRVYAKNGQDVDRSSAVVARRPVYRPRRSSSGLLFGGVVERELPAPDTVRETRKIFESGCRGGVFVPSSPRRRGELTKSRSASSLLPPHPKPKPSALVHRVLPNRSSPPPEHRKPSLPAKPASFPTKAASLPAKPASVPAKAASSLSASEGTFEVPALRPVARKKPEAENVVSSDSIRNMEEQKTPQPPEYLFGHPKQVGVIKPITREKKKNAEEEKPVETIVKPPQPPPPPPPPPNNTMVFNFVHSSAQRDVTHIENDGLDLSKRASGRNNRIRQFAKEPGVILLERVGESTDGDDDNDEGDSAVANDCPDINLDCNFTFVGGNVVTGKSSLRSRARDKKQLSVSFSNSLADVFEYPLCQHKQDEASATSLPAASSSILDGRNNSVGGHFGGLGSYTPSKTRLNEEPFQLGVSGAVPNQGETKPSKEPSKGKGDEPVFLKPIEDAAISWSGSSASSDMLF